MNHCKTCVHWAPFDVAEEERGRSPDDAFVEETIEELQGIDFRRARLVILTKRMGLCRKAEGVDVVHEDTMGIAEDGSNYVARFRTAAEFGCVMHEAKA